MLTKLDITRRVIIRRFQRRRRFALTALAIGLLGGLLLGWVVRPDPSVDPEAKWISVHVEIVVFFVLAAAFVAFTLFKCPNCQRAPWSGDTFSLNPKRCRACKVRLRDD